MDRKLSVYTKTGHLFAEMEFYYEPHNQAKCHYQQYRRLYDDGEEDENKSVYASMDGDLYVNFRKFGSIDEIRAHDRELFAKEFRFDITDPLDDYRYEYSEEPVWVRYLWQDHRGCHGVIDIRFCFIRNVKELQFLSMGGPRFDENLTSDSLESHMEAMARIPVYADRADVGEISLRDLQKTPAWYY